MSDSVDELVGRIETLKATLADVGVCPECLTEAQHHINEPFSTCKCGTGEDYAKRPLQKLQITEQQNRKLKAYAAAYRQVFISGKLYGSYPDEGEENEMYWIIQDRHVLEEPPENIQLLTEQERFDCFIDGAKFGADHKNWLNGEDEFIEKAKQYTKHKGSE